jgi:hypothetical protein
MHSSDRKGTAVAAAHPLRMDKSTRTDQASLSKNVSAPVRRESYMEWVNRFGGDHALADRLGFLRNRSEEVVVKGTAEREIARRVDMNKTDKLHKVERDSWQQREEREAYWERMNRRG